MVSSATPKAPATKLPAAPVTELIETPWGNKSCAWIEYSCYTLINLKGTNLMFGHTEA